MGRIAESPPGGCERRLAVHPVLPQAIRFELHVSLNLVVEVLAAAVRSSEHRLADATFRTQDPAHRCHKPVPLTGFAYELTTAFCRQLVEPGLAIIVANTPTSLDPPSFLKTLESWVQRTVIHQQNLFRGLLNHPRNTLAVLFAE